MPGDSIRKVIVTNTVEPHAEPDFDSLAGIHAMPDDIAILQHSSGTTGLQKGVALSHKAVLNQLEVYGKAVNLDSEKDVIVSCKFILTESLQKYNVSAILIHMQKADLKKGNTDTLVEQMFKVGAHYGYSKTRRHPSVAKYICWITQQH